MSALCCCGTRRKDDHDPRADLNHHPQSHEVQSQQKRTELIPVTPNPEPHIQTKKGASNGSPTRQIPYATPARIDDLIVNDDDSDAEGQQHQPDLTRRASAALDAVRTRIIRHLSSESDIKCQSAASVGRSQEEVARRAELRRLRHKRIQDELDNDLSRELKKNCSTTDPTDRPRNASTKSVRHASLTSPSQSQPGAGPRDTIEFAVPDGNQIPSSDHSPVHSLASRTPRRREDQVPRQPSGVCSQIDQADGETKEEQTDTSAKKRDLQFSASAKTSQAIPNSETRSTFRLSSSPSWLDRIIGVDNTFSDTGENPSLDCRSALSIWLAAQGLRSRDNSMANLEPDDAVAAAGEVRATNGIKGFDEMSITVSSLSHRDAPVDDSYSQRSRKMSPVLRTSLVSSDEPRSGHLPEPTSTTDEGPLRKSPSEDLALDYAAALAFTSPNDNTSSQYASRAQSLQPSPSRSRANLHRLNTHELQEMQLSPFQWHKSMLMQKRAGRSEVQSSYVTAQDHISTCDLPELSSPPKDPATDHDVTDATSPTHSETASFQIREAELQTIGKRFADVLSRRKPVTYTSRFIEDFSEPPQPTKTKPSLIPRMIHLHAPGKFKHTSKNRTLVQIREPSTQTMPDSVTTKRVEQANVQQGGSSHTKGPSSTASGSEAPFRPSLKESVTDLWQRALRQEAEQRKGTPSRSALSSRSPSSHSKNSLSQRKVGDSQAPPQTSLPGSRQFLEVPGALRNPSQPILRLPQWATPANKKKAHACEEWPKLPMDLAEAPESWARYPAHNRTERNTHAKSEDNVKSQDFAIGSVSSDGEMLWITDKDQRTGENIESRRSASMHGKLGKAVKSSITKLLPFTGNLAQSRSNSLGRRRGSFQLAGEVEYPELEVLPPGIGHILEPEQMADVMSSRRRSLTTSSRRSFATNSVTKAVEHRDSTGSLTQRQRHVSRSIPSVDPLTCKSVEVLPRTPLRVLDRGDKNSTPRTEVFVTPLSEELAGEEIEKWQSQHVQLPTAKSEHILPFYKLHPRDGESAGCTRSITWSGSLSSPRGVPPQGLPEYQGSSRPRDLNASKDSFVTGASFTTAAAD